MKIFVLLFVFTVILGSLQIIEAQANCEIKLQLNEEKAIDKDALIVKFISVLEDSRCPEGVNCIWAGNAKVALKLKRSSGEWKTFELNTNLEKQEIEFEDHAIKLTELTPKPKESGKIEQSEYVATFSISGIKK